MTMIQQAKRPWAEQGAKLRKARERTGISQENFAPLIGTTRRHLIRLEKGEHRPQRRLLARIAERAGVEPDSFGYPDERERTKA